MLKETFSIPCCQKGNSVKPLLTRAFLQSDLCDHTELSSFRHTVGHVEIKTLGHGELVLGPLILPAAVVLLEAANSLHPDVSVTVSALGLAEVAEHQVGLHPCRNRDDPGDGGVRLHSNRPARSSNDYRDVL